MMKRLQALAHQHGATLDVGSWGRYERAINIDAPAGRIWDANCAHTLVAYQYRCCPPSWNADALASAAEDMAAGTSPCGNPDCDFCNPDEP